MTQDMAWMLLRSLLMAGSGFLIGKGYITEEQGAALLGAMGVLFTLSWQAWVKWNTKSVPVAAVEASKADPMVPTIPTVSPATGKVQDGVS